MLLVTGSFLRVILPFVVNDTLLVLVLRIRGYVFGIVFSRVYVRTYDSPSAQFGGRRLLRGEKNRGSRIDIAPDLFLCVQKLRRPLMAKFSPQRLRPSRDYFLVSGDGTVGGVTADDSV